MPSDKANKRKTGLQNLGGKNVGASPKIKRRLLSEMSTDKRAEANMPLGATAVRGRGQAMTNWQGMDAIKFNRLESREKILEEESFELGGEEDRLGSERDIKHTAAVKAIMIHRAKNNKTPDPSGSGKNFQIKLEAGRSVSTLRPAKVTLQFGSAKSASPAKLPLPTNKKTPNASIRSKGEPQKPPEVKKIVPPMANPKNPTPDRAKVMGIQSQLTQKSIGVSKFTTPKKTKEDMLTLAETNFESPFLKTAPIPKTNLTLSLTKPLVFPGAPMGLKTMAKKPRNFGSNFTNIEIISKLESDRQVFTPKHIVIDIPAKKTPEPNTPSGEIHISAGDSIKPERSSNKKPKNNVTPSLDIDSDSQSPELPRLNLLDPRSDILSNEVWSPMTPREPTIPNKLFDLSSVKLPRTPNSPGKP